MKSKTNQAGRRPYLKRAAGAVLLVALSFILAPAPVAQAAGHGRLKVFILAGQSNMEGHAKISTFDYIGDDPATAPILREMRAADGTPRVCDDVWISYLTGTKNMGEGTGRLTAGFGSRENPAEPGEEIGPEFTFGIYAGKLFKEPVLIIKTAWGGKSLHTDFRPPSAGPYVFTAAELKRKDITDEMRQEKIAATGFYYRAMIEHVRKVLQDIKRVDPDYDEKQGYDLAGFVWLQGFNDMVGHDVYPPAPGSKVSDYSNYTVWLGDLIRDVRSDLNTPKLPFVIGVMGVGGKTETNPGNLAFREAMAATAALPEFAGTVKNVRMADFWDEPLGQIEKKNEEFRQKRWTLDQQVKKGTLTREQADQQIKQMEGELISPAEAAMWKRGASNQGYHYLGCAKTFALAGKAFAEAAYDLQKP